jgi:thiamine-phosphate pyrophosphorylase
VIGLAGVERARALTSKPLVAIGGITLENAPSVYDAGADSLAVISAIFGRDHSPAEAAKEFLRIL